MNSSATLRSHGGCAKTAQKRPYVGESDRGDGDDVNDHSHGDDDHHDHARESAHPDAHDPPHSQYAPIPVKQNTIPVSTHMFLQLLQVKLFVRNLNVANINSLLL